jgi:hypothetical protein
VSFNVNLFSPPSDEGGPRDSAIRFSQNPSSSSLATISCPSCQGTITPLVTEDGTQVCIFCHTKLQIRLWAVARQSANVAPAFSDQSTCFFHPDKAFQACCQRCGRFLCALCDLQLGAQHVCPTCFDRGRADSGAEAASTDWRHRDVLYDSIAVSLGWGWILFWPTFVAALPAAIYLHVKYRKAPRAYLIPRHGWRFWMAYVGFAWLPLTFGSVFFFQWIARRH